MAPTYDMVFDNKKLSANRYASISKFYGIIIKMYFLHNREHVPLARARVHDTKFAHRQLYIHHKEHGSKALLFVRKFKSGRVTHGA